MYKRSTFICLRWRLTGDWPFLSFQILGQGLESCWHQPRLRNPFEPTTVHMWVGCEARLTEWFKWRPEVFNDLAHVCLVPEISEADYFLSTTVPLCSSVWYTVLQYKETMINMCGLSLARIEWLAGRSRWPRVLVTALQRTNNPVEMAVLALTVLAVQCISLILLFPFFPSEFDERARDRP